MKKIFIAAVMALVSTAVFSQEIKTNSKITEVTVYRTQARETRNASANLKSGYQEVVLSEASMHMVDASLQVSVKGDATLLSAAVRINYMNDLSTLPDNPKLGEYADSIKSMEKQLRWILEERQVYNSEMELVTSLMQPTLSEKGYAASNMADMANLHRTRMLELRQLLFNLSLTEENLNDRREQFQGQLNQMGAIKSTPVKEIVLSFSCEREEEIGIKCEYLVGNAGWIPAYDIHAVNTSSPIGLDYKAKVIQQTGYDWKNIALKISTSNPGVNNNRPLMRPEYVDYVDYRFNAVESNNSFGVTNMMQAERFDYKQTPQISGAIAGVPTLPEFYVNPLEKDILVEFNINTKQTIRSNGKEHICQLDEYSMPATYRYHAVPKLDQSAFLIARITEFGGLNLLAGDANVFFGETFVGQVTINPIVTSDTLLISLGRDDKIIVKRTRVGDFQSKKIMTGREKVEYEYVTTIRNHKSTPIEIEILDQIPLSRKKEIEVNLGKYGNADYDKNLGKLVWNLKIKPGDSKSVSLEYQVEYEEGKAISAN